ncbi:conserved Plasmodium protein, unknown function [Plasmodium gallinaceum]|uniref:MOLO1 domain-containing protein n=1 Tax=Plasmodium gallinaceum TaxID=5849 RepID=A0A1J1GZC7_PLAGA|nr:conserved Plasmodium protein, unknown function [Plasmodium gallinaceum]CRG97822.1 conserved Plasmodium protein, unknown function [Plasmodium gallinaceum]
MNILFIIMYFFFFFFFLKFGLCGKSNSLDKFYFNDVKSTKNNIIPGSKVLYPLIQDLEENDDYFNIDNIYDEMSFPDPFIQPEECVLSLGISHSWLCDPSRFLNLNEQLNVEAALLKIRDTNFHKCSNNGIYYYQVSVALVPQIHIDKNNSHEKSAQIFAHNLLRKWGIGNKECHDGILFVYIKQLGKFIVVKREGVENQYINENEIRMQFMNTYFATGSLSKALIESLNFVNKKLPSKHQELTNTAKMFLLLILFYIVSVIILYITTVTYGKNI